MDHDNKIYRIEPEKIKNDHTCVAQFISADKFVSKNKSGPITWKEYDIRSKIYYNQRGAGCGKTYESIQLIQNDEKFGHKNLYIYLTKLHSAKDVIKCEFIDQYEQGKLSKLTIDEKDIDLSGKQYKISYNKNNELHTIIIGTIDYFTYAISNPDPDYNDFFQGLLNSACSGNFKDEMKFAGNNLKLNNRSLIIIDEAQDLDDKYY